MALKKTKPDNHYKFFVTLLTICIGFALIVQILLCQELREDNVEMGVIKNEYFNTFMLLEMISGFVWIICVLILMMIMRHDSHVISIASFNFIGFCPWVIGAIGFTY